MYRIIANPTEIVVLVPLSSWGRESPMQTRSGSIVAILSLLLVVAGSLPTQAQQPRGYVQRNLVVNRHNTADPNSPPSAPIIDRDLRNPWGAAIRTAGQGGHFWIANQASETVTEYVGGKRSVPQRSRQERRRGGAGDGKSVGEGKSVDLGGRRIIKKKTSEERGLGS